MKTSKPYKKIPSFWWDFGGENTIIVESDHPKFPVVGRFEYNPKTNRASGCAVPAIAKAQALISDLNAGRVIPKSV